jgi:hypothetical protein
LTAFENGRPANAEMATDTGDDRGRARRYDAIIEEAFMRRARAVTSIPNLAIAVAAALLLSVMSAVPARAGRGFHGGFHQGFHHGFHHRFFFHNRFFFGFNAFPFAGPWSAPVDYPGGYYAPPPYYYDYPPTTYYPPPSYYPPADAPPIAYNSPPTDASAQAATPKNCHKFRQAISIGGNPTEGYGTICEQPDGSWLVVP